MNGNGVQMTNWEKFKYAMDRWGLPVVALVLVAGLFWKDLTEHAEFEKQTVAQQGQMIQLTSQMHEDHKLIEANQTEQAKAAQAASVANEAIIVELQTANALLQRINNEQHGRDR